MDNSIYEVSREDYKSFVNEIKPEVRDVRIVQVDKMHEACQIYSKNTGKCLCERLTYIGESEKTEPERYYIFNSPEANERLAPMPVAKIVLNNKEEVQRFFNFLSQNNG